MPFSSITDLIADLHKNRLLNSAQFDELVRILQPRFTEPAGLSKELVRRGWLTVYQVNQMFQARGQELVLGPYHILDYLGKGGVSQVFKAWHSGRDCLVALKVINPVLVNNPEAFGRFQREMRAVARLAHPNIVRAFNDDPIGKAHFFAMEFVEGTDLGKLVQLSGPLPFAQACDAIRQAALGLQHAHECELVHRDIKPANLVQITGSSLVKVLDLGLARLRQPPGPERPDVVTKAGAMIGTPDYVSPEQARDARTADIRSDIYSLGCTFYYLLSGGAPFSGGSLMQKIYRHMHEEPASPPAQHKVPTSVTGIVKKMMAKQPDERYQTPAEVAAAVTPHCPAHTEER